MYNEINLELNRIADEEQEDNSITIDEKADEYEEHIDLFDQHDFCLQNGGSIGYSYWEKHDG